MSEGGRSAAESEGGRDPPPGPRVRDGPGSESQGEGGERGHSEGYVHLECDMVIF